MRTLIILVVLFSCGCGHPSQPARTVAAVPPMTDARCRQRLACAQQGLCSAAGAACVASTREHCGRSGMCRRSGTCALHKGRCVVSSDADCQRSEVCASQAMCFYRGGRCSSTCGPAPGDRSAEQRLQAALAFYTKWRAVDDGEVDRFWKCTVRDVARDLRQARVALELTDGLTRVFSHYPKSQPGHLEHECLPSLEAALKKLFSLCPPSDFARLLASFRASLAQNHKVMLAYARRIAQRKEMAIREKEIRALGDAFHQAYEGKDKASGKPLAYWNILNCAVPDLSKNVRKVKRPPDTQYIVYYIYHNCAKRGVDHRPLVRKIRQECYDRRNRKVDKKDARYLEAVKYLSGDNRDMAATTDCFKRANQGFETKELQAVAKAFVDYQVARKTISAQVLKVKEATPGR